MNPVEIQKPQRAVARIVGAIYLIAMATGIASESIRGSLIVANDAILTAHNLQSHETLFRASIAFDLLVPTLDLALIAALFIILEPINRGVAVFAAFVRVTESTVGIMITLSNFDALRLLGDAGYLKSFEGSQLQTLARLSISAHGSGFTVLFFLLGIGSSAFAYLWFQSGYIPKSLAALGIFGSMLMAGSTLLTVVLPAVADSISPWYMAPIGIFEICMGVWLLFKGLSKPLHTERSIS